MAVYPEAHDDEWWIPRKTGFKVQCCDCGLVHKVDFRIKNNQIWTKWKRDLRSTSAARRKFKFSEEERDD